MKKGEGRIISRFGAEALIELPDGEIVRATSRRKLQDLVCGDRVLWQENGTDIVITRMLPRRNSLTRSYFRGTPRTIAANIDQIVIASAVEPKPDWSMIDQLFVMAAVMEVDAILLHHKADQPCPDDIARIYQDYRDIGYTVLDTSIRQPDSLAPLHARLRGKTNVLVGQSGVGKSSLTNVLIPEADILTQTLSETTGFGQHTTSNARLYHLPDGGDLIDSPGIRDFTPPPIPPANVQLGFREIVALREQCRFHNCLHVREPNCAVKAAVASGEILQRRYQAYVDLLHEMEEAERQQ
jgi:ribosome biogenesis GTPase